MASPQPSAVHQKLIQNLDAHRRRLLQLDARNPSVFTGRITKARRFDVCERFAKKAPQVLRRVLEGTGSVEFKLPKTQAKAQTEASEHLRRVAKSAAEIEEESGIWNLRLGTCWIEGHVGPHNVVRAPLLLRPATLTRQGDGQRNWVVQPLEGSDLLLNESLLAALEKGLGWRAPAQLHDAIITAIGELLEAKTFDLPTVHRTVHEVLAAHGLDLALIADAFEPLQGCRKAHAVKQGFEREGLVSLRDVDSEHDDLALRGYLLLGLFQQSSTSLFADYAQLIDKASVGEVDQGIIDNLLEAPADEEDVLDAEHDGPLDEMPASAVHTALPCDPSQLHVLREAQARECTVVRGPPGTGKSQVIANLVFDAMARGERVLVVCQKRAALDVVMSRLQQCGVGEWAQVVHDAVADRKEVFAKLADTLDLSTKPPARNPGKKLESLHRRIDHTTAELAQFNAALFAESKGGTVRDLYRDAPSGIERGGALPEGVLALDGHGLGELLDQLESLWAPAKDYRAPDFPLAARTSWARAQLDTITRTFEALHEGLNETARAHTALALRTDHDAMATTLSNYDNLRARWWRFFVPTWWRVRREYQALAARAPDPHAEAASLRARRGAMTQTLDDLRPWFRLAWIEALERALRDVQQPGPEFAALFESVRAHGRAVADLDAQLEAQQPWVREFLERQRSEQYVGDDAPDVHTWKKEISAHARLRWIDEAEAKFPVLRRVSAQNYETLRRQLAAALAEQPQASQKVVRAQIWKRSAERTHPPELQDSKKRPQTAFNELAHQLGKQRRLYSLRKLFDKFAWQLRDLAPCWLMSPEVVSEVLPLERGTFDVVIFDEASQLPLERALPVLYRGKRIVIAGDEQQMPPTRFFQGGIDDEEDDDDTAPEGESLLAESLLEQAKKIYGFRYLTWHYRSEFGDLIEFSNRAFYGGTLCVIPSTARASQAPAIRYHAVEGGLWKDQVNQVEARACVDVLLDVARRHEAAPKSVAVVTVNAKQQAAIDDAIREREEVDPEAKRLLHALRHPASGSRDDALVIKNIENVQGDERDVVVFSTAYGPGPDGRAMRRDFGAINKAGGENRLNVAFTRARSQMHVLCSFEPNDVVTEGLTHRGPSVLVRYLKYARAVSSGDVELAETIVSEFSEGTNRDGPAGPDHFDSEFEAQVCDALRNRGLHVETQHGVGGYRIDLVIVHPDRSDRYILAVECDGATYHSAKSVRDRDVARQAALERKGWNFARVWSRDWWTSPQQCIEAIVAKVEELRAQSTDADPPPAPPSSTETLKSSTVATPPSSTSTVKSTNAPAPPSSTSTVRGTHPPAPPSSTATIESLDSDSSKTTVASSTKTAVSQSARTVVSESSKTIVSDSSETLVSDERP